MPVFDMPLDELETYGGRTPKPGDFDAYWASALAEMGAVQSDLRLDPHPSPAPFAECFDLYFTGVGGARVHAKYLRPKNTADPHPAVLMFHGYTGDSGDWVDKLGNVARGFSVAALDCRGQGGLSDDVGVVVGSTHRGHIIRGLRDEPQKLLFRSIMLDCAQLARLVMDMSEIDATRVGATGASQGGGLTLACAALEPRVKLAVPIYPFLSDYQRSWELEINGSAYEEIHQYFRLFDPRHERETEVFTRLGYIDIQHLADRISADVLMITGMMDTACAPSTQFASYNKIGGRKRMVRYPDHGHETLPGAADITYEFLGSL